ncbi:protein-L-isoaspartate(D-aspartate) O-methyltransferase [Streptomyces hainanensis]|uniref:Protein-L-isoaspartate O-methyltransferase n=1 Tax=Streptomyces hainanensis TaxID=402648 RepID=A0A4V2Y2U7_9ACTN|nr:protein-L-isoaspartate(D-aspartate) O-methyltransferase [Streptomyces hainanensis]TDC74015.1 protein-L-isoaspartate(D-aspartate) O-methyltransferase [Streptomyces hainanensis]
MSIDIEKFRQWLTKSLAEDGHFQRDWQREAFERVPRHRFAPETVWAWGGEIWRPVVREEAPCRWAELVYADASVVTQVDDARQEPTSSISAPAAVMNMLTSLDPQPGDRVLEIGSGSGYNTALLCERVGERGVTSMEIDIGWMHRAGLTLRSSGRRPHLVWGDGEGGWPAGAPYDRLLSTAAVRRVPAAWLEQVRPGGEIVTPWFPNARGTGLIWLRVQEDGTARGWFHGGEAFMPVRGQGVVPLDVAGIWAATAGEAQRVSGGPSPELDGLDAHGRFALGVWLPGVVCWPQQDGWFLATDDGGSWARSAGSAWWRHGPRDLVREAADAVGWWQGEGSPSLFDFGITVTGDRQEIWLRSPERVVPNPRHPG